MKMRDMVAVAGNIIQIHVYSRLNTFPGSPLFLFLEDEMRVDTRNNIETRSKVCENNL